MPIVVTDQGLQAIRNADVGGFLIDLTDFKLTSETNFSPSILDEALAGTPVFSGKISVIEALGTSSVKLTLSLPKNFPVTGSVFISEVGIYLSGGELFAHGKLASAFEKNSEFGFDIYVIVSAARLGEVINVTNSQSCSISSTPHVRTLLPPKDSLKNAISVLDELTDYRGTPTGSLAIKFGSGSMHWAFVGYTRMYLGNPGSVGNYGEFNLDIETKAGFWLNNDEVVIVQIIAGPGAGESRKVKYTKTSRFSVLEKNFSDLTTQSVLAIWRSTANLLPSRDPAIPDYFMLQKGSNNWGEQKTLSATGALLPYRFNTMGNGTTALTIPGTIATRLNPLVTTYTVTIHKNSKVLPPDQYALLYDGTGKPYQIQLSSATLASDKYDVLIFSYDPTSTGASLYWYEAPYEATAETVFNLPIIPDSVTGGMLAYLDGSLVTNFSIVGATAVFTAPVVGDLILLPFVSYEELGLTAQVHRTVITAASGQQSIETSRIIAQKKDTLVFVNGSYIKKDAYQIQNNTQVLLSSALTAGDVVDIISFYSDVVQPTVTSVTGRDSGPVWADPAGANAVPNAIALKHFSSVTDGGMTSFNIDRVGSADYVWVFIQGCFQYSSQYSFFQFTDKTVIRLNEALTAGLEVDIFGFYESSSPGEHLQSVVSRFTSSTSIAYSVLPPAGIVDDSWMVFQDGVYQHRSRYTYNSFTGALQFSEMLSGSLIEFVCFKSTPAVGYRTDIGNYVSSLDQAIGLNRLSYVPESVSETMVFLGSVYQNKDQYELHTVLQGRPVGYVRFNPVTALNQNGVEVCTIAISSKLPATRLVLRDEFQTCCDSMWNAVANANLGGSSGAGSSTLTFRFTATLGQVAFDTQNILSTNVSVVARGVELATDDYTVAGMVVTLVGIVLPAGTPVVVRDFGVSLPGTPSTYVLPPASAQVLGGVKVGSGLSIDAQGILSAQGGTTPSTYVLPPASAQSLGGVQVGSGLSIDAQGILSALGGGSVNFTDYTGQRAAGIIYRNTSGSSKLVYIMGGYLQNPSNGYAYSGPSTGLIQSIRSITSFFVSDPSGQGYPETTGHTLILLVPDTWYYQLFSPTFTAWYET